jgi:hypothetical protein
MNIGQIIVWIIVDGFAGTLAGRIVTLKKESLGRCRSFERSEPAIKPTKFLQASILLT